VELRPHSCKVCSVVFKPAGGVVDVVDRGRLGDGDGAKKGVSHKTHQLSESVCGGMTVQRLEGGLLLVRCARQR